MQSSLVTIDESLRAAILVELHTHGLIAKAELRVGVLNSIAHLAGKVDTLAERAAAEEIARRVDGVRGVVNRIEAPGAPSPARMINLNLSSHK